MLLRAHGGAAFAILVVLPLGKTCPALARSVLVTAIRRFESTAICQVAHEGGEKDVGRERRESEGPVRRAGCTSAGRPAPRKGRWGAGCRAAERVGQ